MSYAELHCLSHYSFLRGASHPADLIKTAKSLGYQALAITDECSLAGVVKAHAAAQESNLHLILGSEFKLDEHRLISLVTNQQSYSELSSETYEWPLISHLVRSVAGSMAQNNQQAGNRRPTFS